MKRILKDFELSRIAAVDRPCQEGAVMTIMKRDQTGDLDKREFSGKQREKLAHTGAAMPGGGYPIENKGDLSNAIRAIGRAKNPAATRRHIKQRAKALGASDMIPDTWKSAPLDERISKQMEDGGTMLDFLRECDCADSLCKIYESSEDAASFLAEVEKQHPDAMDQIEAAFDVSDQIAEISKRITTLVEKARRLKNGELKGLTHTSVPIQRGREGDPGWYGSVAAPTSKRVKRIGKRLTALAETLRQAS